MWVSVYMYIHTYSSKNDCHKNIDDFQFNKSRTLLNLVIYVY